MGLGSPSITNNHSAAYNSGTYRASELWYFIASFIEVNDVIILMIVALLRVKLYKAMYQNFNIDHTTPFYADILLDQ